MLMMTALVLLQVAVVMVLMNETAVGVANGPRVGVLLVLVFLACDNARLMYVASKNHAESDDGIIDDPTWGSSVYILVSVYTEESNRASRMHSEKCV